MELSEQSSDTFCLMFKKGYSALLLVHTYNPSPWEAKIGG
jgi:hypothetical protein